MINDAQVSISYLFMALLSIKLTPSRSSTPLAKSKGTTSTMDIAQLQAVLADALQRAEKLRSELESFEESPIDVKFQSLTAPSKRYPSKFATSSMAFQ